MTKSNRIDMKRSKMLACRIGAWVAVIITGSARLAQMQPPEGWPAVVGRLERAALRGSTQELRQIRDQLIRRLSQSTGERPESLTQYSIAYAGWRMATLPDVLKSEQDDLLDDAAIGSRRF
jgi:hypothetical protein